MPIILIGNSFKYEIEATLKLFFNTARYSFSNDRNDAVGNDYVIAEVNGDTISAEVKLGSEAPVKSELITDESQDKEHEMCRLIYHILSEKTGITPPWGLMTGIRPVKKVIELIRQELPKEKIFSSLRDKYEVTDKKLQLAYDTAVNQLPILDRIDSSAVSLYVSIPFCPTRCSYCSFVSHSMDSAIKLMPEYISALCRELEIIGRIVRETDTKIDTIYFGGGTPTSVSAQELRTIMEAVEKNFDLDKVREYSVEAGRPDTITEEKLRVIKELGAERISVNPQTLNDDVLKVIGRKHTGADAVKAFELARKIGFKNINTDLIAGLPTESADSLRNTLDKMIELDPESITVHTLTIKRSANLFESGSAYIDNPAAEMVDYSIPALMSHGYLPYYMYRQKNTVDNLENVGYAKKGFESYYNIFIMDETQTILGAGCAASTKLVYPDGKIQRIHNYKFPYEYIRSFDKLMDKKEEVTECLKKIKSVQPK
ncbi:coproporphyrinogen dehydrogenase HemZ [Ruminococcus flavefaciens]|uniref:coproporphyrinogen dehydrogenase HemZ n=1 Tax=Ruminococcus flavefaciens TaxID=1265 RepID=UPI0026EF7811|nr:coproporphyrinogen dehydrogenase HemZ [Ruminococcus flavefaciens]MDD7517655.1 coproporphyrinogen dehydrogenase HemZ [Ruminococcus flavefaciens]MDY5692401.1 coproporphyrinogen dehydrogenase HemZ [Ruminococcus flavefaciens]